MDEAFMKKALELAIEAASFDEVPVGAVIVRNGEIIAEGRNDREGEKCATRHAEIVAIENACKALGGWRLPGCTLYVTLEPCPMCAGAIVNSRIERVVFGAYDAKAGFLGSLTDINSFPLNHKFEVKGGILEEECRGILSSYFKNKRKKHISE